MAEEITGYELSRNFFNWCFDNPELVSVNHVAIYFFAIEHCNRLGWKDKFGFPTQMTMDALGIKKHGTYIKYFNDLVEWGFILLVQKSTNQYSANIISVKIAMPKNGKARGKALDKAFVGHAAKQTLGMGLSTGQSTGESNSSIDKPLTINQETNKPLTINQYSADANLYAEFISFLNSTLEKKYKGDKKSRAAFSSRIKEGVTLGDIKTAIQHGALTKYHVDNNFNYLTPEFFTRADKIENFKNAKPIQQNGNKTELTNTAKQSAHQANLAALHEMANQSQEFLRSTTGQNTDGHTDQ